MTRLRLLLLLAGLGALLSGAPAGAVATPAPGGEPAPVTARSAPALAVLQAAATASRTLAWSGTQRVVSSRGGEARFTLLQVQHRPGTGSTVRLLSSPAGAVAADVLDQRLLDVLARHYDLRLDRDARCTGRQARVVEALRPGATGSGAVAGRFWVDRATGLVLRRDVLDEAGAVVRSSAFTALQVGRAAIGSTGSTAPTGEVVRPTGERLTAAALARLERDGWPVARQLPSGSEQAGMDLFEARLHEGLAGDVLQLSYSDGLSTTSLFVQKGALPRRHAGAPEPVAGGTVWVSSGPTERMVWAGDGRTWTMVSDAPDTMVRDAVDVLPHDEASVQADGVLARAWRGMSRVGAWLNPFD
ncbi:MAG: sigma-E factor regulatory protein RseB domain-containing protein [Mycobacteriales bacterium]